MIRAVDTPSRDELRAWFAALQPGALDVSVPADQARYVALADAGRGAVDNLLVTIDLSSDTTTQLLAGPAGAGKTTELNRLRGHLGAHGYEAVVVDITRYLSEVSEVQITEFLVALAVGAHDRLVAPGDARRPGFVARLGELLRRLNLNLDIAGVRTKLSATGIEVGVPGSGVSLDLARELKESQPFVDQLRARLSNYLPQLHDEVAAFLRALLPENDCAGSVVMIDGLEKLSGTGGDDAAVQQSVEILFAGHAEHLRFASHHLIYTVPSILPFVRPGPLPYDGRSFVPVPHVRSRGGDEAEVAGTIAQLRELVGRRVPVERVFGETALLDTVIQASGGHLRDVLYIVRELVKIVAKLSLPLPVSASHVTDAVNEVAREYAETTVEQAEFIRVVATGDGECQPTDQQVPLMGQLLRSQMLLSHTNGSQWYEVHPLARRALGLP